MGSSSVIGHSLGSLILFDLLSGQTEEKVEVDVNVETSPLVKPKWDKDLGIGEVFAKLGIEEHLDPFTDQGVGVEELLECGEEDLKEANLPLGPRKKLLAYLQARKEASSGFQEFQQNSIAKRVSYSVGPAGTGQPSVRYPKLDVQPSAFFALGSPIGMFMAVRGVGSLGESFKLPACPTFLNIFHPYDPVAYRIESLVDTKFSSLRPVVIPHHMGRKRMHLELKDTMTRVGGDIKAKVMESLKATMGAVYSVAGTLTGQEGGGGDNHQEERSPSPSGSEVEDTSALETTCINQGARVDHVLQEAPMESFNEYVFALASHLCYWESEDTMLLILRQIYANIGVYSDDRLGGAAAPAPSLSTSSSTSFVTPPSSQPLPKSTSYSSLPPSFPTLPPPPTPYTPPLPPAVSLQPPTPAAGAPYTPPLPPAVTLPTPAAGVFGMDPTVPMERTGPLPPPPTMGFTR